MNFKKILRWILGILMLLSALADSVTWVLFFGIIIFLNRDKKEKERNF